MSANYCEERPTRGLEHRGPCARGVHCHHDTGKRERCGSASCALWHPVEQCCWCRDLTLGLATQAVHGRHAPTAESVTANAVRAMGRIRAGERHRVFTPEVVGAWPRVPSGQPAVRRRRAR